MNYVFKAFVAKFLNLYIDNFEKSQVLLYQGALNLSKVQLKLQTINKLLRQSLLPFIIIKADIDMLKIDIPWSSLNSPIKTYVSGLNVIIEYQPISGLDDIIEELQTRDPKLSIQNEMRKHKEIDEQKWKRFVKRLLLNLSFTFRDVQVELLIKQKYRLQVVLQDFQTNCQDNHNINPDDSDQFHRIIKLDTFFIKFIRFKDDENSYSNQQLVALDQVTAFIERNKDSIHFNMEINNFNLIVEKDIILLIREILDNQIVMDEYIQNNSKIQPNSENFILQDITRVSKGIKLFIMANNTFIQIQQLCFFIHLIQIVSKQFASQFVYKIAYQELEVKYNAHQIIQLIADSQEQFSIWPEYFSNQKDFSRQIQFEVTTHQDRLKHIDQKIYISINSVFINIAIDQLAMYYPSIIKLIKQYSSIFDKPTQPEIKQNKQNSQIIKKINIKFDLQRFSIQLSFKNQNAFKLLLQSQTILQIQNKGTKIKNVDYQHSFLQFEIFDEYHNQNQNILLQHKLITFQGLQINCCYSKAISFVLACQIIQFRLHKRFFDLISELTQTLTFMLTNNIKTNNNDINTNNNNNKTHIMIEPILITIDIKRILLSFGETVNSKCYYSLIEFQSKELYSELQITQQQLQQVQFSTRFNIWTSHPLTKMSYKISNTIRLQSYWNQQPFKEELKDKIVNSLQVLNQIDIKLSQISISNLLLILNLLKGQSAIPLFINKTKRTILIDLQIGTETYNFQLLQDMQQPFPKCFDTIDHISQFPSMKIRIGIEFNESLIFYSKLHTFSMNSQFFSKFTILDEIDQQEYDIFLKAKNQHFIFTQNDKLQIELEFPTIEPQKSQFINQTIFNLLFKIGNLDAISIERNSVSIILANGIANFQTKLTEQCQVAISLCSLNVQEIKFQLKEIIHKNFILSFNFVKIETNFYNVLLSIEIEKDFKCQYITKIVIKPFINLINLLPWEVRVGGSSEIYFPITVDPIINNQIVNISDDRLEQFYKQLLENRKNTTSPSQQVFINKQQIPLYFLNFLNDGKYALEIQNNHHMLMIFRNNSLINNQLCFIICKNVYQSQIKYLLLLNRTNNYFVLIKNKSRLHINPNSENCLEYNLQKDDKYRLFITDNTFELLQLLDQETLTKNNLKVNKQQINNIHFLEVVESQKKMIGKEFKICVPKIDLELQISNKNILKMDFDLNIRFFSNNHLDILIQNCILSSDQQMILRINDFFSIIELTQSNHLNLLILNNFFFKIKEIKINIQQPLLNQLKLLIQLLRLDPLFTNENQEENQNISTNTTANECIWHSLRQQTIIILNLILEPIAMDINIQTNIINMQNQIQLAPMQIKMKKYRINQLKQEVVSFYLAYLLTKIPTISLLLQNIPNPLKMLTSKQFPFETLQLPQLFIQLQTKSKHSCLQYIYIQRFCQCYHSACLKKCDLQITNKQLSVLPFQNIQLQDIQYIVQQQSKFMIQTKKEQIILESNSKNVQEIVYIIKTLLY